MYPSPSSSLTHSHSLPDWLDPVGDEWLPEKLGMSTRYTQGAKVHLGAPGPELCCLRFWQHLPRISCGVEALTVP